ncbi:hypothetical protein HDU98_011534, partial [Podochytrium sp. JEL0797]
LTTNPPLIIYWRGKSGTLASFCQGSLFIVVTLPFVDPTSLVYGGSSFSPQDVASGHKQGVKVYMSVGGEKEGPWASAPANPSSLSNALLSKLFNPSSGSYYGAAGDFSSALDGIDIDMEDPSGAISTSGLSQVFSYLGSSLSNAGLSSRVTVGTTPLCAAVDPSQGYFPMILRNAIQANPSVFNYITPQFYNADNGHAGRCGLVDGNQFHSNVALWQQMISGMGGSTKLLLGLSTSVAFGAMSSVSASVAAEQSGAFEGASIWPTYSPDQNAAALASALQSSPYFWGKH